MPRRRVKKPHPLAPEMVTDRPRDRRATKQMMMQELGPRVRPPLELPPLAFVRFIKREQKKPKPRLRLVYLGQDPLFKAPDETPFTKASRAIDALIKDVITMMKQSSEPIIKPTVKRRLNDNERIKACKTPSNAWSWVRPTLPRMN